MKTKSIFIHFLFIHGCSFFHSISAQSSDGSACGIFLNNFPASPSQQCLMLASNRQQRKSCNNCCFSLHLFVCYRRKCLYLCVRQFHLQFVRGKYLLNPRPTGRAKKKKQPLRLLLLLLLALCCFVSVSVLWALIE